MELKGEVFYFLCHTVSKLNTLPGTDCALNTVLTDDNPLYPGIPFRPVDYSGQSSWTNLVSVLSDAVSALISSRPADLIIALGGDKLGQLIKIESDTSLLHRTLPLLFLQVQLPNVYTQQYLFATFAKSAVAAVESKSSLCVQSGLILLRRLLWPIGPGQLETVNFELFNSLTDMSIHLPVQNVRLNGIVILKYFIIRLSPRALYALFLHTLPSGSVKVAAFLIPHLKDFLLSKAADEMNLDLLWKEVLKVPEAGGGDIATNIDRIMPTLNLLRGVKLAQKCPEEITPQIQLYLEHVTTDISEGRKYYEIESTQTTDQRKAAFFSHAMVQVDLVNSILQLVKKLF